MKTFFFLALFLLANFAEAQVGIGTTNPDASSILDVKSTVAGFLPPRMTTAQRNAIVSPAVGLFIFNTSINCMEWWAGSLWYNGCGTTFQATIPNNSLCIGKTISKTPCSMVAGATLNDDPLTTLGVEYDWSNATNSTMGIGLGATTNTRALVEIGGQCWCRYNTDIVNTNLTAYANTSASAWSGYYNDAVNELAADEGRLYQWPAAMQGAIIERSQGVCPAGFHIPSDCEWMYLEYTLGMSVAEQQNSFFRNTGNVGQDISLLSSGGTNSSGFTGLLAGQKNNGTGVFTARAFSAYWWTSSETSASNVVHRGIDSSNVGISRNPNIAKPQAFCLRCIKD
ncbi:fibrobacter succinogenes major paralogous domain-containing protein [Flavobacterium sp.]|uniref:fibrobacter succinogenes major paralogous domain-containing protein n=1 Tax=Flavobacterium sp. TaxID=239 RepID=UPI00286AAC93|nr:fibrobacter succinogenes major paralogous domain-containing protein [Flavobacterium sp.]